MKNKNNCEINTDEDKVIPDNLSKTINYLAMKSPLTTSLRKQTPINKKAIPYMTANKSNFNNKFVANKHQ